MILLDPELEPGSRQHSKAASLGAVWGRGSLPWAERLPTPRTLARFLAQAQDAVGLSGQVTVLLTTDAALRDLNCRFRGKAKSTDVLSFPASAPASGPERIVGDIAISVETARRQAAEQGHSLGTEIKVLILHGLLHLAGYDHESDAGQMRRRERDLRAQLGLPQGLIERTGEHARPKARRIAGARPAPQVSILGPGKARTQARTRSTRRRKR